MITKLEINGFKTFENFEIAFSPFVIIAGSNGSGKSNLFRCYTTPLIVSREGFENCF